MSRTRFGLRTRLLLALVAASLATLAATWLVVLPTLESRFERDELSDLRELARTVRPELEAVPAPDQRPGSPVLARLVDRLHERTGGRIVVYGSDGTELADTVADRIGPVLPPGEVGALRAAALRHPSRVVTGRRDGAAYATTVAGRPDALTLVISKRLDDSRVATSVLRAALPLALVVGLGVAIVLGLLLSRALSRGLGRLRADAEALAIEGLEHRVSVSGADEIAVVAQALEDMRARLVDEQHSRVDFLATASHELRTPLASLLATLELLQEELQRGVADPETVGRRTEAALRQTRRLTALASDLLDLSRVDGGIPLGSEALELGELVESIAHEFAARLTAAGRTLRVDAEPALAFGDPVAVARIVRILLDNAAKYGAGAVTVTVTADGSRVQVAVEDEGEGIPDEERERMFQRFVRGTAVAGAPGGAGLGLAIARGLARAMDGDLAVAGARFALTLRAA